MKNIEMNKEIWEGWRVRDYVEELDFMLNMIQSGQSWKKPLKTRAELKKWCMENQPYYKKHIPEVVEYFSARYNIN